MTHIESRPSKANPGKEYDFYIDYICSEEKRAELVAKLKEYTTSINLLSRSPQQDEGKLLIDGWVEARACSF
jgi:prephenate dehydratase